MDKNLNHDLGENKGALFSSNQPIRDTIYEILKELIISGDILPGERIIESSYAKQYNISRTPIREALRKLEQDGLVEYRAQGAVVRQLTEEEIREIYIIRQALENLALQYAVQRVTLEDIEKLHEILNKTEAYIREEKWEEASKQSRQIHLYFYKLSGLKRVQYVIGSLNEYMDRFAFMILVNDENKEQSAQEHAKMIEALQERNVASLLQINGEHLQRACEKCIKGYIERVNLATQKSKK